jgi:heat shock protein HslJ
MNTEDKFVNALNSVESFRIYGNLLVLYDSEGKTVLSFERHYEPLGEWILSDNPNVTISFDGDGNFGGHAPVNYFGGKYIIHGTSLTFSDGFDMTMMSGSNSENKAEDAFFKALGKTAGYGFVDGNLVFLDAKGKAVMTFERA